MSRLPACLHYTLGARTSDLVVRSERCRYVFGCEDFCKQCGEHTGVFDGLTGTLALEGCRGVRCIAHHCDATSVEEWGGRTVEEGPSGDGGEVEELKLNGERGSRVW